jgi:FkbM family methyltransferase
VVLLAGAGEDISFDVEFVSRHSATAIICDPTPRAIAHHQSVLERIGREATEGYSITGLQPVAAYDLSRLSPSQLVLAQTAIAQEDGTARFFPPQNPLHVSHSITNWQRGYTQEGEFITVTTSSPQRIAREVGVKSFPLVKLDIEGAELDLIPHVVEVMSDQSQLLVEFDGLFLGNTSEVRKAQDAVDILVENSFYPVWGDKTNFLFVGESLLEASNLERG